MGVEESSTAFNTGPIFFIEAGRIKAGTTDCALLQQFFTDIADNAREELYKIMESRAYGDIEKLEDQVNERIKEQELYSVVRNNDLEIIPSATVLNRISTPLIAPDMFFYLCNRNKTEPVNDELASIKKNELNIVKEYLDDLHTRPEESVDVVKKIVNINKIEGELLGYPPCCIKAFAKAKEEGRNHEIEVVLQYLKNKDLEMALDCFLKPQKLKNIELPHSFYSHFTSNFYPCTIDCEKAIALSKKNEQYFSKLEEGRYKKAYKGRLVLNVLFHLATCYGSYRIIKEDNLELNNEYRKNVCEFFDRFDADTMQLMEKIKDLVIYSPNEIGDAYLRQVIKD